MKKLFTTLLLCIAAGSTAQTWSAIWYDASHQPVDARGFRINTSEQQQPARAQPQRPGPTQQQPTQAEQQRPGPTQQLQKKTVGPIQQYR